MNAQFSDGNVDCDPDGRSWRGVSCCHRYGDGNRELVGMIAAVNLEKQRLTLINVTERDIPQGDTLTLNATKIKDLQLLSGAASAATPGPGDRRRQRSRGQRELKRDVEAFGMLGDGGTDDSYNDDFDFAGSNAKFNKEEDFAQFKMEDEVPESERLVSHNLRGPKIEPKMSIHEMVLGAVALQAQAEAAAAIASAAATAATPPVTPLVSVAQSPTPASEAWTTDGSVLLTPVSEQAYHSVVKEAVDIGLSMESLAENAGTSLCDLVLHLLSTQHNAPCRKRSPPVVAMVIGPTPLTTTALCAARRLAGRNVRVIAYVPPAVAATSPSCMRLFAQCGVHVPTWSVGGSGGALAMDVACGAGGVDVVVDAYGWDNGSGTSRPEPAPSVVAWINSVAGPRVSLGHPAGGGQGADDVQTVHATACVQPTLPLVVQRPLPPACQLYIIDVGIPWPLAAKTQPALHGNLTCPSPFFTRSFCALNAPAFPQQ
eukprot:m.58160 g.58160  ORF g.58160 m.58160 type:complete len:486 (-) comp7809_c0_seq2:68-1525(-)